MSLAGGALRATPLLLGMWLASPVGCAHDDDLRARLSTLEKQVAELQRTQDRIVRTPIVLPGSVSLQLPRAPSEEALAPTVLLHVTPSELFVDGEQRADGELDRVLRERLAREPGLRAVVSAEGATPHGRVLRILDALKRAGIQKFALDVK